MDATVTQLSAFVVAVIATTPTIETVTLLLKVSNDACLIVARPIIHGKQG